MASKPAWRRSGLDKLLPILYASGMDRTTQRKGDVALTRAIASFTELGYDVALPITESAEYDLIVDTPKGLFRVQVKYSSNKWCDLRKIHSNSKGYVVKSYSDTSYDWLYVYSPGHGEFLMEFVHDKSGITLKDEWKLKP